MVGIVADSQASTPEHEGEVVRRRVVAYGLVQGVFFRDTCGQEAQRLGVTGSVRNAPDGTVVATFEGSPSAVEQMIAWTRRGPSRAHVERVEVTPETPQGDRAFTVR
jgi:acylphosphatase